MVLVLNCRHHGCNHRQQHKSKTICKSVLAKGLISFAVWHGEHVAQLHVDAFSAHDFRRPSHVRHIFDHACSENLRPLICLDASSSSSSRYQGIEPKGRTKETPFNVRTKQAITEKDIMDVAALRNDCRNPTAMIASQQERLDSVDRVSALAKGLAIGAGVGGGIFMSSLFLGGSSVSDAAQSGTMVGAMLGLLLGGNNYFGSPVHVMTEAEAVNRLKVDFVAGLVAGQDVSLVAYMDGNENEWKDISDGKYVYTRGIIGAFDGQLRNDAESIVKRQFGDLPPHLHLKNLLVDKDMRGRGVGKLLVGAMEDFAKKNTKAKLLTLEVESSNTPAVKLYENAGFVEETTRPSSAPFIMGRKFMVKML